MIIREKVEVEKSLRAALLEPTLETI